jgi:DNA-directed RNA polymerase II subunit RPB1
MSPPVSNVIAPPSALQPIRTHTDDTDSDTESVSSKPTPSCPGYIPTSPLFAYSPSYSPSSPGYSPTSPSYTPSPAPSAYDPPSIMHNPGSPPYVPSSTSPEQSGPEEQPADLVSTEPTGWISDRLYVVPNDSVEAGPFCKKRREY